MVGHQMNFTRIRISKGATVRLQQLKGRTGLTPNILSRIAICYSLNDPKIPNPSEYDEDGQEFNRYTLTGEWDSFFIALIKERCIQDGLDPEKDLLPQFKAHLNRGVFLISPIIKDLSDFQNLLPKDSYTTQMKISAESEKNGN